MIRSIFFFLLFFCLITALSAWGRREEKKAAAPEEVMSALQLENRALIEETSGVLIEVSGRVRLIGGGIFPDLVITGETMEWYVERKEEHKLRDLQHQTVTVEGEETVKNLFFANGFPAGERRTLRNIKVINIQN